MTAFVSSAGNPCLNPPQEDQACTTTVIRPVPGSTVISTATPKPVKRKRNRTPEAQQASTANAMQVFETKKQLAREGQRCMGCDAPLALFKNGKTRLLCGEEECKKYYNALYVLATRYHRNQLYAARRAAVLRKDMQVSYAAKL